MNRIVCLSLVLLSTPANAFGLCWPQCSEVTELDDRHIAVSAQGTGFFSVGLNEKVMAEAARQTLAHGYTNMRLMSPQESTQFVPQTFTGYRNGAWTNGFVGNRRVGSASVVVSMCNAGEPECRGALSAQRVLQQYGD